MDPKSLQPIKLNESLENVFVVSDLHFDHNRDFIWGKRGFQSVHEHNTALVNTWNNRVSSLDTVFHLGDLIFGDVDGSKVESLLSRLRFKELYLLVGNHVSGQKRLYQRSVDGVFISDKDGRSVHCWPVYGEIMVENRLFTLSHYPIVSHKNQSDGSYMLCGHSHGNFPLTNKNTGKGRRLDVGIESFGGPISLKEVVDFLSNRDYNCVDHH